VRVTSAGHRVGSPILPFPVSDLPAHLAAASDSPLADHIDVEGKLPRALDALGPVAGRDVVLVGGGKLRTRQLESLGARVAQADQARSTGLADASADVVVGFFSAFRGVDPGEIAEADRVLRPRGRLLIVHEYGRDDVSRLGDPELPEYRSWGRREGPFLRGGFKVRVIHCWWTFDSPADATDVLEAALGEPGRVLGSSMTRPRLSHNVAVYHRDRRGSA
jgi:SAM-dependent methyltransferase